MTNETRVKANRIARKIESLKRELTTLTDFYDEFNMLKLIEYKNDTWKHTLVASLTSDMEDSEFEREDVETILNGTKSLLYSVISCRLAKLEQELEEL